jgi:hypothetical protein
MRSSHDSSSAGKRPRSQRQALLEAGSEVFGYVLSEAVGDAVVFLTCPQCGGAPATLQIFPGDQPVDAFLGLHVWCNPCSRDVHHVVTIRPATSAPPRVSPSSHPSISPNSHPESGTTTSVLVVPRPSSSHSRSTHRPLPTCETPGEGTTGVND